ncbi:MAG: type III PLP-dependent enzyme [Nitratireductor sp.]|nr:type III PLP-dependent enzyme [Nitratireductor sp.]
MKTNAPEDTAMNAHSLPHLAHFRDARAVVAARMPDRPLFCFSRGALIDQAERFLAGFPGHVSYAVKCNPWRDILLTLRQAGIETFDVASLAEIEMVRSLLPEAVLHYHNPIKSRGEIEAAFHQYGCRRLAIDCAEELAKIAAIAGTDDDLEIAIRFVLPRQAGSAGHDFSTKFGASPTECAALLRQVAALGYRPVLTFHPGSQCADPAVYARHIAAAGEISRMAGIQPAILNVGGGFPAEYEPARLPPLEAFFNAIAEAADTAFTEQRPQLECEPGRGMAASCMSLLTRVKLAQPASGDLFLNDGIYGGLMELPQSAAIRPPYRLLRQDGGKGRDGARTVGWKTFGPTCDPLDVLPGQVTLPADLQEGDYVEFGALGAYALATVTPFNGYGGHEIVAVDAVHSV